MNDLNLPSYAKLPNGPHEPNLTPRGVMVVEQPHKMAKTLMKFAQHLGKPKATVKSLHRPLAKSHKKDQTKWY